MGRAPALGAVLLSGLALGACGGGEGKTARTPPAIEHVHGLGINPEDEALLIATHEGLFRLPQGSSVAERVGATAQDTMGFTVLGPNRFLGSGHPAPGDDGPPSLGLIASDDGGESWRDVSLAGSADLHVLRYSGGRIYAFDALTGRLLISEDEGESWTERSPPPGLIDLAVDPTEPTRVLASTQDGLLLSEDGGRRWSPIARDVGLLAWPDQESLFLVDAAGDTRISRDGGESWKRLGSIGAQPSAFAAADSTELYAARTDGTVLGSSDGGATWEVSVQQ